MAVQSDPEFFRDLADAEARLLACLDQRLKKGGVATLHRQAALLLQYTLRQAFKQAEEIARAEERVRTAGGADV